MTERIYPRPETVFPQTIWEWVVYLAIYVPILCLAAWLIGWWFAVYMMLFNVVFAFVDRRRRTIVTGEHITVEQPFVGGWKLDISEARELVAGQGLGKRVYVVDQSGHRRRLNKVKPKDLAEISELTGCLWIHTPDQSGRDLGWFNR